MKRTLQFMDGYVPTYFHAVTIATIANVLNNNSHVIEELNNEVEELKREIKYLKKARENNDTQDVQTED